MNGLKGALCTSVLLATLVVAASFAMLSSEADDVGKQVLIDMGDGDTYWSPAPSGSIASALSEAAKKAGLELKTDGGSVSVDGISSITVGEQTVGWRLYVWEDAWKDVTGSASMDSPLSSSMALGLYPAGTVPTETPVHKESWSQVRGNASMDRMMVADLDSDEEMKTVYAWSRGSNDYVTGTVLVARGNAYAFFNGGYMNTQSTPALYCADRFTGETKWIAEVPAGVGYETMTGCIVGDYYYLPTSYGYIYKIPLEGPGEDSLYVQLSSRLLIDSKKAPAVTYVGYKNPGDESYSAAAVEAMDTTAFDVPVEVGRSYDIVISDGERTYKGRMDVNAAGALGVKIVGSTAEDKALIADFSTRVTHSYSDVSKTFVSKTKSPTLEGRNIYNTGPASLTSYGGAIFFGTSAGYAYAMDLDLNVLWKSDLSGQNYYDAVMVDDGRVFVGTYSGKLFALDASTGEIVSYVEAASFPSTVYGDGGRVCTPVKIDDILFFSTSDGLGMNSTQGGFCAYAFKNDAFVKVYSETSYGQGSTFMTPVASDKFKGVYFATDYGLMRLSTDMKLEVLNEAISGIRASPFLVNGTDLLMQDYAYAKNGVGGNMYRVGLDGKILAQFQRPAEVDQWTMSPMIAVGDRIYSGTDNGFFIVEGKMPSVGQEEKDAGINPLWIAIGVLAAAIAALLAVSYLLARRKNMSVGKYLGSKFSAVSGFRNDSMSKTKANKRRLAFVLVTGILAMLAMFICCLAYGPSMNMSPWEAISDLFSAVEKGGNGLTLPELVVYESRLPRAIAAIGVGVGLAIAGCVYQAVIRNPMVDPYIMGVSSGAGTFAVAGIASGFTFFGILENSDYMVPVLAIVGGLIAFGLTMLLASKAGNTATGYVLAGVVIGLAFTSVQTVILTTSDSDKLHNAISWLYGSFTSVDWGTVWLIFFPALFISFAFFIWAKELNLVLLGDDNAQQMGLNVKRFDAIMLIMASVLTSVCVAFVGIIGFVGLVVPHVCRMILGGDHRLVLPASMVLGAALMLLADLLARMIMIPLELPVGAITTVVGVPLFAYLLVKRGKMYNG